LLYGVLLPGPHIGREAGDDMRKVRDAGFEVGLHTFDHVRWQDYVVGATPEWTRIEFERGMNAFREVFGHYPKSHAAAGWQINATGLELEAQYCLDFASDTRGRTPFWPMLSTGRSACPQLPTTLPTFDELLGLDGVDESNIADALYRASATDQPKLQVFTLHAELEGMRLLGGFEQLLRKWQSAGAVISGMRAIHDLASQLPRTAQPVEMGTVPGRSGLLAVQPSSPAASA
jgi:undecaprenyl phosphate-alpha-L-ara4FN deformylase